MSSRMIASVLVGFLPAMVVLCAYGPAGARNKKADADWRAAVQSIDTLQDLMYMSVQKRGFKVGMNPALLGLLKRLRPELDKAIRLCDDDDDRALEISSRFKIAADFVLRMASLNRRPQLVGGYRELLTALYLDEENPVAGFRYYLGLRSSRAFARGTESDFARALKQYSKALSLVGRSTVWSERIKAHVHLRMASHRAVVRKESQRFEQFNIGLGELGLAFQKKLLSRRASHHAQTLYGKFVHHNLKHLVKRKKYEESIRFADKHLSRWFSWQTKAGDFLLIAEALREHWNKTRTRKKVLRSRSAGKIDLAAERSLVLDTGTRYIREKALHFARQGLGVFQARYQKGLEVMKKDKLASYHFVHVNTYDDFWKRTSGVREKETVPWSNDIGLS